MIISRKNWRIAYAVLLGVSVLVTSVGQCQMPEATAAGGQASDLVHLLSEPVVSEVAERVTALSARIEEMREAWMVPGLSVAIVKDGRALLCAGYGQRRSGGVDAVDEHTLFAIASNTKAFTAAALAILVDDGKLRWDEPVADYLPWLKLHDPVATLDLRIRDLLCHRSGLGTFSGDLLWWGTDYTPRQVLERTVHLKPTNVFRAEYGYSNLMYLAAGELVAQANGQSWGDFVQQRILEPLGMTRTVTSVTQLADHGNFATPHKSYLDRSQPLEWMNWDTMAAAGGIISSAEDMSRWLQLQLDQGEMPDGSQRLFSLQRSNEMWQAHTPLAVKESSQRGVAPTHFRAYGLGWVLSDYRGRKLVEHSGGYDGMYSQVLLVPEEKFGVVVLTNSMTSIGSAIAHTIVDAWLVPESESHSRDFSDEGLAQFRRSRRDFESRIARVITPAANGTQPSQPAESYCGTFRCPMYGDAQVSWENNALVLKLLPNSQLVGDLTHLHYDTYRIDWREDFAWFGSGTAHFVANSRGRFRKLELDVPNDDLWFYELQLERIE